MKSSHVAKEVRTTLNTVSTHCHIYFIESEVVVNGMYVQSGSIINSGSSAAYAYYVTKSCAPSALRWACVYIYMHS